jgi:hypothetical protein
MRHNNLPQISSEEKIEINEWRMVVQDGGYHIHLSIITYINFDIVDPPDIDLSLWHGMTQSSELSSSEKYKFYRLCYLPRRTKEGFK